MSVSTVAPPPEAAAPEALSPWTRALRVFARPAQAWSGLEARAQWWIPAVVGSIFAVAKTALDYERAIVPMQMQQIDRMVENGQIPGDRADQIAARFHSTAAFIQGLVSAAIGPFVILLLQALLVWFGVGFILGGKMRYRLALEAVGWASLVTIPVSIVHGVLAYWQGTMDVRLGFGALMPPLESASHVQAGLTFFLESIGPFNIWYLVVMILGAAALSGSPRKNVAWVLVALYLALSALFAAVGAMFVGVG